MKEGDRAPTFKLPQDGGGEFDLAKQKGKIVVLYFYPKDDTSGCTVEALNFSEKLDDFSKIGAIVVGISPDTVKSHNKFKSKHNLSVTLVADVEKQAIQDYGVWGEKQMFGRTFMGVERSTFIIGKDGRIVKAWRGVKVPGHADEVLKAVQEIASRKSSSAQTAA